MNEELHSINALRSMEVIDINTGGKVGFIKDIKIDYEEQRVISIILPGEVKGWFSKTEDIEIPWTDVVKVGIDVLIIKFDSKSS